MILNLKRFLFVICGRSRVWLNLECCPDKMKVMAGLVNGAVHAICKLFKGR